MTIHSGFLYGAPVDLAAAPTGLQNVLVIGSCLISAMPEYIKANNPGCNSDYILFNNGSELPAVPQRPVAEYDFQLIQIGTRSILAERAYFRLDHQDEPAYVNLLEEVKGNLTRVLPQAMRYNAEHGLLTFVANFLVPQQNVMGRLLPRYDARNPVYFFEEINRHLAGLVAGYANAHMLDLELLSRQLGKKYIQDDAVWSLAHNAALSDFDFPYDQERLQPQRKMSETYELRLYDFVRAMWAETVAMFRTVRQMDAVKLVAVDLDDTLWRGVLAESREVSWFAVEGWPLGFIEALLTLKRRGILLAIISKNDEATVARIWHQLFRGLIALEDFAVRKINWNSKAENLAQVLNEVNILPRSAVYIDDNPVERAVIADAFPEVRLLGADPYLLKRILLWAPETQVPYISGESARRTEMVQRQAEREEVRAAMSRPEFLASLQLRMRQGRISSESDPGFARAFELINKTNQYNSTGVRWRLEEARAEFAAGGAWLSFEVEDRFSNYGLVAVALLRGGEIVQFVMSCRVVGMEVEIAAIALAAAEVFSAGGQVVQGRIVETDANFLVRGLFQAAGFEARDGVWQAAPGQVRALPPHINIDGAS